ncbi:MAG: SDR family oxidoreductase [Chloroflexi bacterium]|nr:SDR family oxidoreductase [Chloroflexota bacterium]
MAGKIEGKVALITGAGSGMGRAMANLFAKEGSKIVAGEWNDKTLAEVVAEVRAAGGEITGKKFNVAVQAEAEGLIDAAVSAYGQLDILCNNAGVMDLNQGVGEVTDEMWQRVLSINLNGPMYMSRRAVPIMIKQGGGSIINTASVAGIGGGAAGAAYTVSKHALIGLTRSIAWMYGPKGIRCNAMACGGVETNIMTSVDATKMDPEGSKRTGVFIAAMPGLLKAIDIANLALFLASPESRNINGAIIPADAGWSAA